LHNTTGLCAREEPTTVLEDDVRLIFMQALEREPDQWAEFLNMACPSDPELRARVDELLQAHGQMGGADESPTPGSGTPVDAPLLEGPGTMIGPYRLLEQIGEGGFGIVYMAEQTRPVRRKVALKIIKPGMDTRQVIARFEAERQALALMDHPNIARVFDGGATEAGRPFFAMELVRGIPITDFCDQNRLPIRQRIELLVTVCQAVQHAHQRGIIHRDLKPSNVMVTLHDDTRVVKVIDFGIAKAVGQQLTEKTLFTNFAQMIGTPLYMSPEQAQMSGLDVDTRCDIYALGVLLYELLTGMTPFDQDRLRTVALDEVRRIIREEEPPRPSTRLSSVDITTTEASARRASDPRQLSRLIRGELDWIVMKCLNKDRNRRYETANGLAVDLLRYLNAEPVEACPPSLGYRLRVFARRHRAALGTAGLLLAITAAGCALTVWQAVQASSARNAAVRAQLALSMARQDAAEERANAIARDLETLNKANSLIESGRSHIDFAEWAKAESDLGRALALRPDHSAAWLTRGDLYARLGLLDLAAADFQRAWRLQEPDSVSSLYLHALLRFALRDETGYRAVCERMARRFDNPDDPRPWQQEEIACACLLAEKPIVAPDRLVMLTQRAIDAGRSAVRLASLGTALYRAGQYESALGCLREAKAADPAWETTWTDSVAAMIDHRLGRPEEARAALRSAADSLGRWYRLRSDNPAGPPSAHWWYVVQGHLHYREAKRLIEGAEPAEDPRQWSQRGDSLAALERYREAIASFTRAIELDPKFERALSRRAETYLAIGEWPSMLKDYERLLSLQPGNASYANELAWRLCTCPDPQYRDYARAAELARKAVALSPSDALAWNTLGAVLYRAGDWTGSVRATLESMELTNALDVRDWLVLAMCQWQLGQKARARQLLNRAARWVPVDEGRKEYLAEFREEAVALIGTPEAGPTVLLTWPLTDPTPFTLVLESEPNTGWAYALRGVACASLKQWDQAAADFARATQARPNNHFWWYALAIARLGTGDTPGYRGARSEILKRFGNTKDPQVAGHLCYVSAIVAAEPGEADAFLRMAEFAARAAPGYPRVRGAMNYRGGKYEASIADLNQSARVAPPRGWDWLILAMAHHHLGHADEAKKDLDEAVKWIEQANRTDTMGAANRWMNWHEPVEVEFLLREARALIQ
jgi:serine/threonine protein kinase/tetratricopeptide (TPR) repeat protein